MNIKRDWVIAIDEEEFVRIHGDSFARVRARPATRQVWEESFAEAAELVQPAAVWETFPIRGFRHEKVVLENGHRIGNGPVTGVVGGATHLIVSVCTIGQAISDRCTEHQRKGDPLRALLLDHLGSWAAGMLRQQLCHWLEAEAIAHGLRTSTSLSPGESVWSIKDQAVIFALIDGSVIGVTLTESMLMKPIKSLSLIMGTGSQPMGVEGATNCDYCTMADQCIYRHAGHAAQA